MSQFEVRLSLNTKLSWKLAYSFQTLTLTKAQCHQIMGPIVKVRLQKAGIPTNSLTAQRYATASSFGFSIMDPYDSHNVQ